MFIKYHRFRYVIMECAKCCSEEDSADVWIASVSPKKQQRDNQKNTQLYSLFFSIPCKQVQPTGSFLIYKLN